MTDIEQRVEELEEIFIVESVRHVPREDFYRTVNDLCLYPEGIPVLKRKLKELYEYRVQTRGGHGNRGKISREQGAKITNKGQGKAYPLSPEKATHYQHLLTNFNHHKAKEKRHGQGLTQAELAEKLGINSCDVSHFERGRFGKAPLNRLKRHRITHNLQAYINWIESE